jgi:diacylglycerol kinase family enzyme
VRAVALLGPYAKDRDLRQFELPGVNLFSGNELDPTDQPDAALIFGGDGTIHRHLGKLALTRIPALIVPLGSANDFAQSIGVDSVAKALAAWRHFCTAGDNTRNIDLGTIQPLGNDVAENSGSSTSAPADLPRMGVRIMKSQLRHQIEARSEIAQPTFFSCIAGAGLDSAINRLAMNQPRWLRGHGGYVIALLQTLRSFRPPHITVSLQSGGSWQTRVDEAGFLVAAGNGPQYGNGMRLTHRANMDDGLLDLCFVRRLSKARLLRLFRVVYRGRHIGLPEVEYFQAERVRLAANPVSEVFADGEYICTTPVELAVRRQALRVIVPPA